MTTALIAGGGIAGTVTAMALHKAGIDATVYEAYPDTAAEVGAFMTLMNNGLDALRAIDCYELVVKGSFPVDTIQFFTHTGKHLGDSAVGATTGVDGPHAIKRAELYNLLRTEAVTRGIPIDHGKRLKDAFFSNDGVTAVFEDGSQASGDILIGADGIHSVVRKLIDPEAPTPSYRGATTVCGYASSTLTAPVSTFRFVYGKRVLFAYTTAPDSQTWWFANCPGPELSKTELAAITTAQWRDRVLRLLAGDRTSARAIVTATDTIVASNSFDIEPVPTWHRDSMIVIGDAAHVSAPNAGHGASMAIEDSIVLAQCLRDLPVPKQAFLAFEQRRRERVERVVATSARMGNRALPGPVGRIVRDLMLPRLLKRGPRNAADWLTRYHIDWDERVASLP